MVSNNIIFTAVGVMLVLMLVLLNNSIVKSSKIKAEELNAKKYLYSSAEIVHARKILNEIKIAEENKEMYDLCLTDARDFQDNKQASNIFINQYCKQRVRRYFGLPSTEEEYTKLKEIASRPLPQSITYNQEKDL